jgi:hypothetical protein
MRLINHTPHKVDSFRARHPKDAGRLCVVVAKATFALPDAIGHVPALPVPSELLHEDLFVGQAGFTAPAFEADFVPLKPHCDVIVVGHAHAPSDRPVERMTAGIRLGTWQKLISVVGPRRWERRAASTSASAIQPFLKLGLGYEGAFGGTTFHPDGREVLSAYLPNPVGLGYFESEDLSEQQPLPWIEAQNEAVTKPDGRYVPMSLGVLPRNSESRVKFAGTYDATWRKEQFPDLPLDFDPRYFQSAASDQWIAPPVGGEEVVLLNLSHASMSGGTPVRFQLPDLALPMTAIQRDGTKQAMPVMVDTLLFEPDQNRYSVVWRAHVRLPRDETSVTDIQIGSPPVVVPMRGHVAKIPVHMIARGERSNSKPHGSGQSDDRGAT